MTIALHALLLVSLNVSASPRTTKTSAAKNIAAKPSAADTAELTKLKAMAAVLQPTDVSVDISGLPAGERGALHQLVEAAKIMDALFLRQVSGGNDSLLLELANDNSPLGMARRHEFIMQKGPWDRLDHNQPFLAGIGPKFPGGNFYPADASKEEIEAWEKSLPDVARHLADGFYSVIRRNAAGKLTIVPYHVEYQPELMRAAKLLEDAAALTANDSLKTFLNARAQAFLNDDYYQSEVAWMNLDSVVDPTIGPYEVYEDDWFNAKAAFEAFINVRDNVESDKLTKFAGQLQDIENHLPIEDKYKNPKLGALAPIAVVNVVYTSGDANKAVQTAAYNLPNDERVTAEKGTKRVMLKNVQEAKFRTVLLPIAKLSLDAADQKKVAFDAFFTHILMHELMHGLGPHTFDKGGKSTTVREQLKETYSAIEEAKADATGMFALQYLIDHGQIDKAMEQTIYVTFLASGFRTLRFGLAEAHGKGMAIQLNTLLDNGAFKIEKDGTFSVDASKVKAGVEALTHELLTVEAEGSCDKALQMLKERAVIRPEVQKVLDKMKNIPIDIEPRYTTTF